MTEFEKIPLKERIEISKQGQADSDTPLLNWSYTLNETAVGAAISSNKIVLFSDVVSMKIKSVWAGARLTPIAGSAPTSLLTRLLVTPFIVTEDNLNDAPSSITYPSTVFAPNGVTLLFGPNAIGEMVNVNWLIKNGTPNGYMIQTTAYGTFALNDVIEHHIHLQFQRGYVLN